MMKKRTVLLSIVVVVLLTTFVFSTPGISQSPPPPTGLEKLEQDTDGKVEITWNSLTDTPSFVRGSIPLSDGNVQSESDTSAAALSFVERYADLFGVSNASQELNVVQYDIDTLGMRHVTLQQVYQGVEVYGASIKVHLSADGLEVAAVSSGFVPGIALDETQPRVTLEEALAVARQALPNSTLVADPKLVVYPSSPAHLVWLVQLRDDTIPVRNMYVIDAVDMTLLDVFDRLYVHTFARENQSQAVWFEVDILSNVLSNGQFPYGPNVQGFNVEKYLREINSPLAQYANLINERARWYSINPRVLLTILEMQAGLVTNARIDSQEPKALLHSEEAFATEIEHLALALTEAFYMQLYQDQKSQPSVRSLDGTILKLGSHINAATFAIAAVLAEDSKSSEIVTYLDNRSSESFSVVYQRLFPDSNPLDESNVVITQTSSPDAFQLPFTVGDRWVFMQGPHDWDGNDTQTRAFIDLGLNQHGIVNDRWITAAAAGTVTRYRATQGDQDCWVDITHDNGWVTRYYHVANLQVADATTVVQDDRLGNPSELTCNGGSADGAHVHFGLLQPSGAYQPINGTLLSGWEVVETGFYAGYLQGPEGFGRKQEGETVVNPGVCGPGRFHAEYYNNRTLDSDPVFTRCEDPPIAYNWGNGAPGDGVGGNNFSVRWTGWFSFTEDTYHFAAQTDDGMRVWVDETLLIDAWRDQRPTSYEASLELDKGPHQVKVEYYENAGGAVAHLRWWGDGSDTDDGRLIASGEMLWGNIQPDDDVDTYYFSATEGQQATIHMKKNFFTPSLDPYLVLYAPDGREIALDDDGGEDTNALINRTPLTQTGNYRIEAQSYGGNSIGLYHISLMLYQPGQSSRETYDAAHGYSLPGTLARSEGDDPIGDQDVDDAHDFAGATYNYYWNTHGRDSYDDEGATLVSTANYGRSYMNAYWNGEQTVYGDHFPVKDVVAHEWTHAVTEHSAALEYRWQSGALNESFSDIFGAMVDRDDWLIGEDLPPNILGGREAIRDMADPARFGQPAHTDDWVETCSDNEGVHTNNGILNKAYYNIATAIGKDKAEHIFYRVLTVYLDVNSSMDDARAATLQSTWDLSHTLSYAATYTTVYTAVHNGFDAVGLDGVWQPDSNDCSCAASTALSDETVYPDKLTALETATTLYRARDQLLIDKAGEHYRLLYEQHTGRINYLLLRDAPLRVSGARILKQVTPGMSNLMNGVSEEDVVTQKTVDEILAFLHQLAEEDQADGDGDLADTIEREMALIEWDHLVGMTYGDAWTYIQSRVVVHPIYLPLVMK